MIDAIRDYNADFQIIWDLGRKCTYACSYCPPHRNNKWSPNASLTELKSSFEFVQEYTDLYDFYRKDKVRKSITFTGGEPTVNPAFFDFIEYVKTNSSNNIKLGLTTNGFFSKKRVELIKKLDLSGTISYHPEATMEMKKQVVSNMLDLAPKFKINVMFHKDYFQECVELCEMLNQNNIKYIPRIIGDEAEDKIGLENGWAHKYTKSQMNWFKQHWDNKKQKTKKITSNVQKGLGRPCCGGRCFQVNDENKWKDSSFLSDTNFKGWSCMVNWYFLYLHQELDLVWTHQTCGVNLDNKVAPMGKISEGSKIIEDLENKFYSNKFPIIRCPKISCGCGMCINKAKKNGDILEILNDTTRGFEPTLTKHKNSDLKKEKRISWAFCKKEKVWAITQLKK